MVDMAGRNPPNNKARAQAHAHARPQNPIEEEQSDNRPLLPPNYVSLSHLRERRLKEQFQKDKDKEKESDNRPQLPLKEEKEKEKESAKGPPLPPNYVSLRQPLREEMEKVNEKEKVNEEEKGGNYSLLPTDYVSLRQLKELRLKEKDEKEAEEARLQQIKEQQKGDEVELKKKAVNLARNLQSRKAYNVGHMKSSWVWRPVLQSAGSSSGSSPDAVLVPDNAGASGGVSLALSDQNAETKNKRKKRKGQNKRRTFGKNKCEVVKGPDSEGPMEEVTASRDGNNSVKKGKGKKVNLNESGGQSTPVRAKVKGFNKGKGKEVVLKEESSRNVVPVSEVAKGSDGVEEVIGSKIENGKEKMEKGKMVIRGRGRRGAGSFINTERVAEHLGGGGGGLVWVPKKRY